MSDDPLLKRCPKCTEYKPLEAFAKDPTKKGGRRSHCKVCTNSRDMTEYRRNYDRIHAEEIRERKRLYYLENKKRIQQVHHDYYVANAHTTLERQRMFRMNNPEIIRARARAREIAHRDTRRALNHKRRARKKANGGTFTREELTLMRLTQGGVCAYCQRQYDSDSLTIDHIIPLAQGGRHEAANICLACEKCNKSKNDRTPEQWTNRWYWREQL